MLNQRTLRTTLMMAMLAAGCSNDSLQPDSQHVVQAASSGGYGYLQNGTGVHIGSTQPESWFGLTNLSVTWFMSGFSKHADGSYWATGWYSTSLAIIPAEAKVQSARLNGVDMTVQDMRTTGSQLRIDLRNALGTVTTVQDAGLVGLTLLLRVPDPTGLTVSNYRLRFGSSENIDSTFGDVRGYQVDYMMEGLLGGKWSSYCKGSSGESQRSVFYQGSQWSPLDGSRSDGANLLTMTCESGSVARCMSWGYRPWGSAQLASGQSTSLRDHHQACVHMKRASYCGDSQSNTVDGTRIFVNDPFQPAIHSGPTDLIEALWSPSGATCLTNRRHPEIPFVGCPLPLPTCPSTPPSDYYLMDSLSSSTSLLGLID